MALPFFSIIIPTYNAGAKLSKSLDSVLDQGNDFEIIVMDAASTDDTVATIRSYAQKHPQVIRWHSEKDKGVYDAMNKAIDLASGKYLYFLGAGDTLREGALRTMQEAARGAEIALLYGGIFWVDRNIVYNSQWAKEQLATSTPCHQAIFYDRRIFDLVGRYDLKYRTNADWALNIKCFGDPRIEKVYINTIVANYEGGGLSAASFDKDFARDRGRLAAEYLNVKTTGYLYFFIEQTLATRIERAQSLVSRKFWHGQLWLLHNIYRPIFYRRHHRQQIQRSKIDQSIL